ncbi:hypothetical protein EDC96DRAFT_578346 [Choanephora cucurbitarum]|nr:hypothetical protein EDC96DRAFT_578346 [Choanephora cucurbitarum]
MRTSNKKALIDQMSLKMLDNYEHLTNNEKKHHEAKLVIHSRHSQEIALMYTRNTSAPLFFWRGLCLDVTDITKGMNEEQRQEVEELFSTLFEKCKKDVFDGLGFIYLERSKLLKQRMHESYPVLQVFEYIGETVALNIKEPCLLNEYNYSGGDNRSFNMTGCSSSALSSTKSTTARTSASISTRRILE